MPSPCHPLLFLLRNRSCHFISPWGSCSSPHNCCISWLRNLLRLVRNSFWMFSTIIFGSKRHLSTFEHQKGARPLFASGVNLSFFLHCQCFQFVVARSQRSVWTFECRFKHKQVKINENDIVGNSYKLVTCLTWCKWCKWCDVSDVSDVSDVAEM